jgi:hypothetical protein
VIGALLLALQAAGRDVDEPLLQRLGASYAAALARLE